MLKYMQKKEAGCLDIGQNSYEIRKISTPYGARLSVPSLMTPYSTLG